MRQVQSDVVAAEDVLTRASGRRYDIDWLRTLACYGVLVLHVAMVFGPESFYHIRNSPVSFKVVVFIRLMALWYMPLFFVVAGWATFASLRARGTHRFLRERVRRLLIPLIAGCVLFGPPIKYFELRSGLDANHLGLRVSAELQESFKPFVSGDIPLAAPFNESFSEFWPTYFTRFERFTWSHLWFLAYLLVFTVLYLPLFLRLMKNRRGPTRAHAVWAYLPIVPLALVELTLRPFWPTRWNLYADWANLAFYSICLVAGFLLAQSPVFEQAVHQEWKRAIGICLVGSVVWLLSVLGVIASPLLLAVSRAVVGWSMIVVLLGFAHSRLMHTNALLGYLNESAYPVYILHQAAVVCIGYWVIQLPLGMAAKYGLLLAAVGATTMATYHFVVRPSPTARFALGMKPARKRQAVGGGSKFGSPFIIRQATQTEE